MKNITPEERHKKLVRFVSAIDYSYYKIKYNGRVIDRIEASSRHEAEKKFRRKHPEYFGKYLLVTK